MAKVPQEASRKGLFGKSAFEIDGEANTVTCPAGQVARTYRENEDGSKTFVFRLGVCGLSLEGVVYECQVRSEYLGSCSGSGITGGAGLPEDGGRSGAFAGAGGDRASSGAVGSVRDRSSALCGTEEDAVSVNGGVFDRQSASDVELGSGSRGNIEGFGGVGGIGSRFAGL